MAAPVALAFGRLGLSPNALTLIGFALAVLAGILAGTQNWATAGLVLLGGAVFDLFDGTLARATGQASRLGAFMDSTFDRWGEAAVYVGVITGCAAAGFQPGVVLAGLAMSSAFMVSYARARAESLGFAGEVGIAPRPERVVILTAALVLSGLAGGPGPINQAFGWGSIWLGSGLALISILASVTVVQRTLHVRAQSRREGDSGRVRSDTRR